MAGKDLLGVALRSGEFPNVTARRLRNLVMEAFGSRYLIDDGAPARLLKTLFAAIPKDDLRSLCFIFTCRANLILGDFIRQVYWPLYASGRNSVARQDSREFVLSAVSNGRTTTPWSKTSVIRVASYLLGACGDFGLLGPMKAGSRSITTFRITPNVASVLAHDLHFRGLGDNALLKSADWGLFGLEAEDALGELRRLSLRRELIVQSAAGVAQVSWKHKSMKDLADAIAEG